jgi:hypothetical protein
MVGGMVVDIVVVVMVVVCNVCRCNGMGMFGRGKSVSILRVVAGRERGVSFLA